MVYKKQIIFHAVFLLVALFLTERYLCNPGINTICYGRFGEWFPPVFIFLSLLFFFYVILYFLKEGVYLSWRIFCLIFLPIAGLCIYAAPEYGSGSWMPIMSFDREITTFIFATLFFFISLILIIYKSIKLHFLETKSGQR